VATNVQGGAVGTYSPFYSYNLQTETKINIDELIYTLSPLDLPLLTGIGGNGNPLIPRQPVDNTIFYWLEEDVPLPRGTLLTALADGTSSTSVVVNTGEGIKFHAGDGIRIDDEVMTVTSVSSDTLTVIRGLSTLTNTAGAAHATGAEVIGLGTVLIEGALGISNYAGRDRYSNYTQIFSTTVQVSRTEQRIPKYGVPNELNRQLANSMHAVWQGVEQAAVYGIPFQHASTFRRQTGGLSSFLTTNTDAASSWLTISSIEQMQQLAFNRGGMFPTIIAKPQTYAALNNLAGNERIATVTLDDARRGRSVARTVMTEFGDCELYRSRWIKSNEAYGYNSENFIMRQFQPMVTERLAKTDDTDKYMVVMEAGFEVKGQAHMGKWTNLDVTSAMPGTGLA